MARLKKRKDGYLAKSFMYNGKRIFVYGKTAEELSKNELKKRQELENSLQSLYNPTLNEYYEHFTDIRRKEIKEATIRAQRSQYANIAGVKMAAGLLFGEIRIKDVKRNHIEMAREILLDGGKTPQNLNICFSHLNHVFNCALIDEIIDRNPCAKLKPLKRDTPPARDTKHRALTTEETRLFFETAAERNSFYFNAFLLMIKSGMRIGEIGALQRIDIDRKNGFIHIRHTVSRDESGNYYISSDTKTMNSTRDIPLTTELSEIIKNQAALNEMIFGLRIDGLLFKSSEGTILREYTMNREIKRICTAAGIEPFTCHAFRNTFATRFIEQRPQDYKILSEILGHKDISITLNLYTHVMTENKITAMNEILIKTS